MAHDLDPVHLDHDGQDGDVEAHEQDAVKDEDERRELAKLFEARDVGQGADDEDGDLDRIVSHDRHARALDGGEHNLL